MRTISIKPPLGGIQRRFAVQGQAPYSTISAENVLGQDNTVSQSGRDRISTRPGLTSTGGSVGVPRSWAEAYWTDSGAQRGIIVACDNGLWRSQTGASFVELITDAASSDFASCVAFMGVGYFARGGQTCLYRALSATSDLGTALSNAGGGTAPTKCGVVGVHASRLVLMGDTDNSQTVYFSAVADPTNWNYAATTDDAAVSFTVDSPPTAFISHTSDCGLIGTVSGIVAVRGNPTANGVVEKLSHFVGPLNQASWTHDSTGRLWYLSQDGLYSMPPGCGDFSASVSREALPEDLVALNPGVSGTYTSISYDPRFRSLWIYCDLDGSSNDTFWSYDLQNGAWWRHTFSDGPLRLGATLKSASTSDKSAALAINASGSVFQYDRESSESFSSAVWFGPLQLGDDGTEGLLHAVQSAVGTDSDAISWTVHVGRTAEEAFASSAAFTGTDLPSGLSTWQHPRRRGSFAYIKLFGTTTDRWSLEGIAVQIQSLGLRRAA